MPGGALMRRGGVVNIPSVLRNYFQPDALDRIYQQATKFSRNTRADRPMQRYLLQFDVLRRNAEAKVIMGGAFPDACVSILRA